MSYPIILSFDVGIINLSYCIITRKEFIINEKKILKWDIIDWDNIDLTNRNEHKCFCGSNPLYTNIINNEVKYYCKNHYKNLDTTIIFEECYKKNNIKSCEYIYKNNNICSKKSSFINTNINKCYCNIHAKQNFKNECNQIQLQKYKIKNSKLLNFDNIKYNLIMCLENKPALLKTDIVLIENQPSFKNPRMKSIASTIYDYYLIRGIIDKKITNSLIQQVKFISPSNKLKLASEGDKIELIKVKNENDDTKKYKLTKSLGIKYCYELISHLTNWKEKLNNIKKKDDLADCFLQGIYYYNKNLLNNIKK